ncbi:MAG: Mth938-like domain-containing protein [Paracoccaceae bacterium]|nr:Mth938-like domain-containing protein [Paracoccaceae bacterium]MDG2259564.1 Mth938-like domain-containing protein [Paracoccaceae bacterium]
MELNEISYSSATPIDGYGPGFFRIGGDALHGPVCLTLNAATKWEGLDDLSIVDLLKGKVDIVLVGTGANMLPVPAPLRMAFEKADIGVEPMTSPSACRTYNVLLAEGRRVAAALIPV